MPPLAKLNPTGRFSGLADTYARYRPDYPAAAIDLIMVRCQLSPLSVLADIGCGTGISSRVFARQGVRVIGIEPNADMRARAEAEALPPGCPSPAYRDGRAEATGLADGSVDVVLAAQAFHWFEPIATLQEFQRILNPGGWVVLVWNERDETDPCTAAFGAVVGGTPEAARVEGPRRQADQPLLVSELFEDAQRQFFRNEQELNEEGFLGRALSASYAPKEPAQVEAFAAALRLVFARFQTAGKVVLKYVTSVTSARRR